MNRATLLLFVVYISFSCNQGEKSGAETGDYSFNMENEINILNNMNNEELKGFQWMNEPETFDISGGSLRITAKEGTDFFVNPEDGKITHSAPFLFQEIPGNFVATACVRPNFSSVWNAAALMVYIDSTHWVKFAFENSDATGKSIVSVVTNGVSDDANGVILNDRDTIWLRIIRKQNIYALHWSADGEEYKMTRIFSLPSEKSVKVGIEAQCPAGKAASHEFLLFSLEEKTAEDLRKGV